MTKWRNKKWACLSAMWMLFAFLAPLISPACMAMSPALCATEQLAIQANASHCELQEPHDKFAPEHNANNPAFGTIAQRETRFAPLSVQTPISSCCCAHDSSPGLQNAVAQSATQRVLDLDLDSFATRAHQALLHLENCSYSWPTFHETRKISFDKPPSSGRAPPVVWL